MTLANTAPMASLSGEVMLSLACLLCGRETYDVPAGDALAISRQGCLHCHGTLQAFDSWIKPYRPPLTRRELHPPTGRPPEAQRRASALTVERQRRTPSKNPLCPDCRRRLTKCGKPRCVPCAQANQRENLERRADERQRICDALRTADLTGVQLATRVGLTLDQLRRVVARERRYGLAIVTRNRCYHLEVTL